MKTNNLPKDLPSLLLRLGLAFVFIYAGLSQLLHPDLWLGFIPNYLTHQVSAAIMLKFMASFELLLALWLLIGRYLKYAALVASLSLASIVITNFGQLFITFRDVGLLMMALTLAVIEFNKK